MNHEQLADLIKQGDLSTIKNFFKDFYQKQVDSQVAETTADVEGNVRDAYEADIEEIVAAAKKRNEELKAQLSALQQSK